MDQTLVEITLDDLLHPESHEPLKVAIVPERTSSCGSDSESITSRILEASGSGKYHIVLAPEYAYITDKGPLSKGMKDDYVELFKGASDKTMIIPGTFVWKRGKQMFNTAYVFNKGETMLRYDKSIDGGDSSIAEQYNLNPVYGKRLGRFQWCDLKIGIEICADGGILEDHNVRDRDLVFLVSCGNSDLDTSMLAVREGGYGIIADGFFRKFYSSKKSAFSQGSL